MGNCNFLDKFPSINRTQLGIILVITLSTLIGCGNGKVGKFIKQLDSPDFRQRAVAADSLGYTGSKRAVMPLVDAIHEK